MVKALKCPDAGTGTVAVKRGRTSDEVSDFEMPSATAKKGKVSGNAPVELGLQEFSDNSKLCGLPGTQAKVCVLMMEHKAKPGLFYKFAESFANFLVSTHTKQNTFPKTMDEFEKRFEVHFVIASDPFFFYDDIV